MPPGTKNSSQTLQLEDIAKLWRLRHHLVPTHRVLSGTAGSLLLQTEMAPVSAFQKPPKEYLGPQV